MSVQESINLAPLWEATLKIYSAFERICQKHGLQYCVAYGTALGAIRHKGFIPWDDDFDVQMPYDDYVRFWEYAKAELPAGLKAVTLHNTPDYPWLFGKLQNVDGAELERIERDVGCHLSQGVYIDVFPIYGYPNGAWSRLIRFVSDWTFCASYVHFTYKGFDSVRASKFHYRCLNLLGFLLRPFYRTLTSIQDYMVYNERRNARYRMEDTELCFGAGNFSSIGLTKYLVPSDSYRTYVRKPFGAIEVPLPHGYDECLKAAYGDYMKLPPESARRPSHRKQRDVPWRS